jgi:hypothetical protein
MFILNVFLALYNCCIYYYYYYYYYPIISIGIRMLLNFLIFTVCVREDINLMQFLSMFLGSNYCPSLMGFIGLLISHFEPRTHSFGLR